MKTQDREGKTSYRKVSRNWLSKKLPIVRGNEQIFTKIKPE